MSDELYPLAPIGQVDVKRFDRTVFDEFEDGSATARRLWTTKTFKRRFTIQHENLTEAEFAYLADFFVARDGRYDSFWYRDNSNRLGNAKVRLAGEFPIQRGGAARYSPQIVLEQTAPVRELVSYEELRTGPFFTASAWYDANRTVYGLHALSPYGETSVTNRVAVVTSGHWSSLTEQSGLITPLPVDGYAEQYQHFVGAGTYWLRSDSVDLLVAQPGATLFCVCKVSTVATKSVLFAVGTVSTGAALGIAINASNQFEPWLGGAEAWTNAKTTNVADTWHSVAVSWPSGSNVASLYVDAVLIGSDTVSRSFSAGRGSLLAAPDGTLKLGSGLTNSSVNHAIFRQFDSSLTKIKAMHNLIAHQYGMSQVA